MGKDLIKKFKATLDRIKQLIEKSRPFSKILLSWVLQKFIYVIIGIIIGAGVDVAGYFLIRIPESQKEEQKEEDRERNVLESLIGKLEYYNDLSLLDDAGAILEQIEEKSYIFKYKDLYSRFLAQQGRWNALKGGDTRDEYALRFALSLYHESISLATGQSDSLFIYKLHSMIGRVNLDLADIRDARKHLNAAITHYSKCLKYYAASCDTLALIDCNWKLGIAYCDLATLIDSDSNLFKSIEFYRHAFEISEKLGRYNMITTFAANLAVAIRTLSENRLMQLNLKEAIEISEQATHHVSLETNAELYVVLYNTLGVAYSQLAQIENEHENLERAKAALNDLFIGLKTESVQFNAWTAKNNLAVAYMQKAKIYNDTSLIIKAVELLRDCASMQSLEKYPIPHARLQMNIAGAYLALFEDSEKPAYIDSSIQALTITQKIFLADRYPVPYAQTLILQSEIEKYKSDNVESSQSLRRSIELLSEASQYFYKTGYPIPWAKLKYEMADRFHSLCAEQVDCDYCLKAKDCLDSANVIFEYEHWTKMTDLVNKRMDEILSFISSCEDINQSQ